MTASPVRPSAEMAARRRSAVRRVASLRPRDWWTLLRVVFWVLVTRLLGSLRGFGGTARAIRLRPVEPVDVARGARPVLDRRALRALRIATRLTDRRWMRVTCLPRSIALLRVLAAHDVAADLVIGGRVTDEGFKAHAWVEIDGRAVYEHQADETWQRLARFRREGI